MPQPIPSWFAADQVYRTGNGWYVGSPQGFRVGPYPREAAARERSAEITTELARCANTGDMVRAVRKFLYTQSRVDGRQLHSGPSVSNGSPAMGVTGSVDLPPNRVGEATKVWFRTSRFFSVGEVWFFHTREDIDIGPYESKQTAETDSRRLLDILKATRTAAEARLAIYQFKSQVNRRSAAV